MNHRAASPADAEALAPLLLEAMREVFYFYLQEDNEALALSCVTQCLRAPDNLYSYQNAWLAEENGVILGVVLAYDGADFRRLREKSLPYFQCLAKNLNDETEAGEYYLDAVAVAAAARGRGLGSALLQNAMTRAEAQGAKRFALLVSPDKTDAKRLYARLGFIAAGKKRLGWEVYEHWVRELNHD